MAPKNDLIQKLNIIRAKTLPQFKKIRLTRGAVDKVVNLFLHPFCISTVDLKKFIQNKPVKLTTLSRHILTAFPNTISYYAEKHHKTLIDTDDILECFALDHIEGVAENKIEDIYSPSYALAHILTLCKVINLRKNQGHLITDLEYRYHTQKIKFKNVFIPQDIKINQDQNVFHHFGVVVDCAKNSHLISLSKKLQAQQNKLEYIAKINRATSAIIDFGKHGLYQFDLTHYIIRKSQYSKFEPEIKIKLDSKKRIPFSK